MTHLIYVQGHHIKYNKVMRTGFNYSLQQKYYFYIDSQFELVEAAVQSGPPCFSSSIFFKDTGKPEWLLLFAAPLALK